MVEIAHQCGAGLLVGDVLGRTAHIDVDDFGARPLGDARALRHPVRLAARELHDMGARSRAFGAQHGIAAALDEGIACRHLGHHKAGARRLTSRRNGASVIPDMGARTTRLRTATLPIWKVSCELSYGWPARDQVLPII